MAKVLLVEDDNNLREIFEMRLQAEGYQTVTAGNGEEGLTVAMKEKPDLIIADVMMPKLSGFDMLESLRAAPEMKNTKVIMMTALGQAEDQARGEKLGVVKYLVKSQATLEDFAKVIKDVLPPDGAPTAPQGTTNQVSDQQNSNQQESENKMNDDQTPAMPTNDAPATPPADSPAPTADTPAAPASNPVAGDTGSMSAPADAGQMTTAQESSQVQDQMNSFASSMPSTPPADSPAPTADTPAVDTPAAPAPSTTFAPTEPASEGSMPSTPPADSPAPTADTPAAGSPGAPTV